MEYAKISVRSLLLRWRQYISLFLVAAVGVAVSLFLVFAVDGMLAALNVKAKIYYGGDLLLLGSRNGSLVLSSSDLESVQRTAGTAYAVAPRYEISVTDTGALFFEGTAGRQRYVKGADFTLEQSLFEQYYYVEGGCSHMAGSNGIIISEPIALQLGCHVGDAVTLMLQTVTGYTNTIPLIVQGIFRDSSIFGMYTSYVDMSLLQSASGVSPDEFNRINFISKRGAVSDRQTKQLHAVLSEFFPMHPLVADKDVYLKSASSKKTETIFGLFPLSSNMDQLTIVIAAMRAITVLVIVVLVLIIVIGISSTYKVIISKRINEIGIYKSIGMKRSSIYTLIGSEALALLVAGSLLGIVLSFVLCGLIRLFDFTRIPSFDIFLTGGILEPIFSVGGMVGICAVVIVTTLIAVLFSVREAVKKMPSEALATTA